MKQFVWPALLATAMFSLLAGATMSLVALVLSSRGAWYARAGNKEVWPLSRLLVRLAIGWNLLMSVLIAATSSILWRQRPGFYYIAFVLSVPVLLAAVPLVPQNPRAFVLSCGLIALILTILSFIAGFSIGLAYPMSAVLIAVGGISAFVAQRSGWDDVVAAQGQPGDGTQGSHT